MNRYIRLLAIVILGYAVYFYLIPTINIAIASEQNLEFFSNIFFWSNLIQFFVFLFCGIGLLKLNRFVRLIWLIYSGAVLFINIPTLPVLIKRNFININDVPFSYWIKIYGLFGLLIFSIIFLNFPTVKVFFKKSS
ncbi:MAG: hypothetical protein WBI28_04045 [Candidatus Omnitrophota bacterium]